MTTNVDQLIAAVVAVEGGNLPNGGYTNNPSDRGGETIYGITVAVARAFGYSGPMIAMPRTTAAAIYKSRFWLQPKFDQLDAISSPVAQKLFDIGVNMGTATGVIYLQRALNVLNNQGRLWPDMGKPDGGFGNVTAAALRAFLAARGAQGQQVLLGMITSLQSVDYIEQAENNPTQEQFEYGWQLNRVIGSLLG